MKNKILKFFPQKIHDHETKSRQATWLELFFDLSMVVGINVLALLIHDITLERENIAAVGLFLLGFVIIFNIWKNVTSYLSRFENENMLDNIYIWINLILIILMTLTITNFEQFKNIFITLFIFSRLWNILFNYLAAHSTKNNNLIKYLNTMIIAYIPVIASSITMYWFDNTAMIIILAIIATYEFFMPLLISSKEKKTPSLASHHIKERYGLLVILVIGEILLTTTSSLSYIEDLNARILTIIMGITFAFAFLFYWIYFTYLSSKVSIKKNPWNVNLYMIYHALLIFSVILITEVIKYSYQDIVEHTFEYNILIISILLFGLGFTLIRTTMTKKT